jgi:hypothetical protein
MIRQGVRLRDDDPPNRLSQLKQIRVERVRSVQGEKGNIGMVKPLSPKQLKWFDDIRRRLGRVFTEALAEERRRLAKK